MSKADISYPGADTTHGCVLFNHQSVKFQHVDLKAVGLWDVVARAVHKHPASSFDSGRPSLGMAALPGTFPSCLAAGAMGPGFPS